MEQDIKQSINWKPPLGLSILIVFLFVCLGIVGIVLWNSCVSKPSVPLEPKPAHPPRPKTVLHSQLGRMGWYYADSEMLKKQIAAFFEKAEVEPIENVIALILPHAGYRYSGQTAAFALKAVNKTYKRVVVIGPTHRAHMAEVLSVPRVTHYETPLGQVPLDVEFIDRLLEYSMFQNVPQAHKAEHSVQIEVPLLQYLQTDFELVPIVAGQCSLKTVKKAGTILRSLIDEQTLVVASSDFVHYGPRFGYVPFRENVREQIKKLDMGAYEFIAALDCEGFVEYKKKTGATICGYIPISILLSMLDESAKAQMMKYTNSGEVTGDYSNPVSYLSAVVSGVWPNRTDVEPQNNNPGLTEKDKEQLLTLARKSIIYALENRRVPQASQLGVTISDSVRQPRAAFVTLNKAGRLRGCIGDIFPRQPLYQSVIHNAINAAFNDSRFPQVVKDECSDITIEISALTAPEPVGSADEIRIGIDGVVLKKDGHSAVFLPQVAPEQGWDINQMLTQLSLKAKLPPDAWKEGASFLVFQADIFGEEK